MDGWEDEYGPCPMPVPDTRWYDQVAVDRALGGEPIGRKLTPIENRVFERKQKERLTDE